MEQTIWGLLGLPVHRDSFEVHRDSFEVHRDSFAANINYI